MKIKDVCDKIGLTERTVRFYAEKELIHPTKTRVNGRLNWEFNDTDYRRSICYCKTSKS